MDSLVRLLDAPVLATMRYVGASSGGPLVLRALGGTGLIARRRGLPFRDPRLPLTALTPAGYGYFRGPHRHGRMMLLPAVSPGSPGSILSGTRGGAAHRGRRGAEAAPGTGQSQPLQGAPARAHWLRT